MRKDSTGSERNGRSDGDMGMDFNAFAPFATQGLEAMVRAGNVWMKGVGSLNEEVFTFSQEQLGKCVEAGQSLARCASVEQALSTQCDLARTTLENYSREANKLLSLTATIARDAWAPVRETSIRETGAAAGED